MKKIIIAALFFSTIGCAAFAQDNKVAKPDQADKHPIFLMKFNTDNGEAKPFYNMMKTISGRDVSEMHVWRGQPAIDRYGDKAKNGAIVITLVQTDNLLSGSQLFKKYNIAEKDQNLPVYVNDIVLDKNIELYFSADKIASVNISETAEKHIDIKTISEQNDPAPQFKLQGLGGSKTH